MSLDKISKKLKAQVFALTKKYYQAVHRPGQKKEFVAGKSRINYGGRFFDEREMLNLVDSSLDFWLTAGPYTEKFENLLAKKLGVKFCCFVNSGSSANLLAVMALTSPLLGKRQLKAGDEVITVAAGFPTTVTPVIQAGAIPVFVDVALPQYNIDVKMLKKALSKKTKAVVVAHTLGNPFDIDAIVGFCKRNNLWLIEDNCDSLGSLYKGKPTGSFGDIATSSFYPPHHITTGEGGAVYTNNPMLNRIVFSMRDWGRDCFCPSGKDNTCKKRFSLQFGQLPFGYDHKYVYSHFGYNLKATDMQAAIGCAQIEKLDGFVNARRNNWQILYDGLKDLEKFFVLPQPQKNSKPSWFGFMLTVREDAPFGRDDIVRHLEQNNIQTRMLFAGNFVRQPAFDYMRKQKNAYKIIGELKNTDIIMNQSFWLGVYPGMTKPMLKYIIADIKNFIKNQA
ncbi:MAG TPA: lipopolysaccharide biosynthesis protein RfbH [Phycisphaerales bacterium]|nr:MAG: lipopolysaccharide biosynthesis protein RfbH [Planctomycetes bacterium GWC2_45_44]HBG78303.1 lipopolysaccharide biosynthesis protein RfbH [Phycisphaerales bacterium]HBR20811.1 lipopolysaccharide biosynthesis protein RfbH [Phycisphaerales bacterium]